MDATLSKELRLQLYRTMQLIRQCEEQLARSHQRGLVHGACHTYVGQEAIAAGVCAHLRPADAVFSTHRGHGHALAKGIHPRDLIAELYGRENGCSHGRGGSMHLFKPEIGFMGTSGIVGPCILQACGGGYSFKILKTDQVAVAFFGDGAVNNGAFHEGLNMASIWRLPVVLVCENNQFATEVPFHWASGIPDVGRRAETYGLPGFELDGNDVLEIYQVAGAAIERARTGGGATLIECKTYRTRAHAEGMVDFTYRTREEVDAWKARCPIKGLRAQLVEDGMAQSNELDAIDDEIRVLIAGSHALAEQSPYPAPQSSTAHVYCEVDVAREPASGGRELAFESEGRGAKGEGRGESASGEHKPPDRLAGAPTTSPEREINSVAATREAIDHEMSVNPRIFVMGEGIGARGGNFMTTVGLFEKYGADRLRDTPICERGFVGLACGAAMTGTRPVIDFMFIDFINDAFGELTHQIARMQYMSSGRLKMPLLLRGCVGVGHSAGVHHSGTYYSVYCHFPGLRVVLPSTPFDAKGLFTHALRSDDPVLFLEHRELLAIKGPVPLAPYEIPFGKASVVRAGTDVTVVAISLMVHRTREAAEMLAHEGLSIELIDPRTATPLDVDTILTSVAKTGRLLIVDEAFGPSSVGAEIAARIVDEGFDELDAPIKRLNGAFAPTPYSPALEKAVVPQVEDIVNAIRNVMQE